MKINCGCGRRLLPGYLNVDLVRYADVDYAEAARQGAVYFSHDLRQGFPPHAQVYEEVRAFQFLEHLDWGVGQDFLKECRNRLTPGGTLHLTVPNGDTHLEALRRGEPLVPLPGWLKPKLDLWPFRPEENAFLFALYAEGHRMFYTESTLRRALQCAGFGDAASITSIDGGANLDAVVTSPR